jgi:hypothetical protein
MTKVSKSPERHTFQRDAYIKRQKEKSESVDEAYLKFFDDIIDQSNHKFEDPESQKNNMEYDLLTTDWILEKVRSSNTYAQNLYSAICNNDFQKLDVIPILKDQTWSASWRSAGGIIADMRQEGDYIDWYCSGIRGGPLGDAESEADWDQKKYVPEGCVTDEIRNDLQSLGWVLVPGGDWEKFV